MFNLGVPELILILVVGIVVFGPKKLPEVGASVGKALREFKKTMNDLKQEVDVQPQLEGIADIKKEVADIKSGLKDVVFGSGSGPVPGSDSVEHESVISQDETLDTLEPGEEDPKASWIQNSPQWTMPEFLAQGEGHGDAGKYDHSELVGSEGTQMASAIKGSAPIPVDQNQPVATSEGLS